MIRRFLLFELETLARRAFIDIDTSINYRWCETDSSMDRRSVHSADTDSLGPNTPMADIVDCCRVWESHREVEVESTPRMSADRCPARTICQITEDEPAPAASPETGNWEDIIRKLLPTPALPPQPAVPIPSDRDVLIQQLMEALCPPMPVARERSPATDLETMLLNWLPVGAVTEEDAASPNPCRTLDESFPFLPTGWQAEHIGDQFILGPGPPARPQSQQMGNAD